jgi:type 1 glutamine amidotransferase
MSVLRTITTLLVALATVLSAQAETPRKLVLVGQGPDGSHPPQTHEYLAGMKVLARCLRPVEGLDISVVRADGAWLEGPELLSKADGVVLCVCEGARWTQQDPKRLEALSRVAARGGGLTALHWAMGTREAQQIEPFVKLFGACHGGPDRKYRFFKEEVVAEVADSGHPVVAGLSRFRIRDEFYYRLKSVKPAGNVRPLLRVPIDGQPETVAWAWERPDGGRSFGFSGMHYHDNWRLQECRRLVAQGVLWTLKRRIPKDGLPVEVTAEDLQLTPFPKTPGRS